MGIGREGGSALGKNCEGRDALDKQKVGGRQAVASKNGQIGLAEGKEVGGGMGLHKNVPAGWKKGDC